jgi:hypothetical protein
MITMSRININHQMSDGFRMNEHDAPATTTYYYLVLSTSLDSVADSEI